MPFPHYGGYEEPPDLFDFPNTVAMPVIFMKLSHSGLSKPHSYWWESERMESSPATGACVDVYNFALIIVIMVFKIPSMFCYFILVALYPISDASVVSLYKNTELPCKF